MDPSGYGDWSFVERSEDMIMLRGPEGYIRLRKTPFGPKPVEKWALSVKLDGRFVERGIEVNVTDREQLWDVVVDVIDDIHAGKYD